MENTDEEDKFRLKGQSDSAILGHAICMGSVRSNGNFSFVALADDKTTPNSNRQIFKCIFYSPYYGSV